MGNVLQPRKLVPAPDETRRAPAVSACVPEEFHSDHPVNSYEWGIDLEAWAYARIRHLVQRMAPCAESVWHHGDGYGGGVFCAIEAAFVDLGFETREPPAPKAGPSRGKISSNKRKRIHERDMYRCLKCGSHRDLEIDHIVPVVLGGTSADDNLQTLCKPCNASKGARSSADYRSGAHRLTGCDA